MYGLVPIASDPPSRRADKVVPPLCHYYMYGTHRASVRTVAAVVVRAEGWRCTRCVRERGWTVSDSYQLVVQQSVPPTPPRAMPTPARRGAVHERGDKRGVAESGTSKPRPPTYPPHLVSPRARDLPRGACPKRWRLELRSLSCSVASTSVPGCRVLRMASTVGR